MAELKPCPFHKKIEKKKLPKGCFYPPEDFAIEDSYMFEGYFHVRCCYCHACGPDEETEQQAIDAWNKRSENMKNYYFHKCIYEGKLRNEQLKQEKWDPLMIGYSFVALLAVVLVVIVAILF